MTHPIQPVKIDMNGVLRFKANAIVVHLLANGGFDMNRLAALPFSDEDREQFAQLIGYSLSGFSELGYVSDETGESAREMAESGISEVGARTKYLRGELDAIRESLREPVARLFGIHPDDLAE